MFDPDNFMDNAVMTLTSEYGKLHFDSEYEWTIKFSEKNEIKYMTISVDIMLLLVSIFIVAVHQ